MVALIRVGKIYTGEALGTCNPKMSQKNVHIQRKDLNVS